ncbi:flagellar hook-basal body complex protein FliE [Sphingomonas sp. LM7]|uniref:flagellar hook-basal body complex protein FliE n=1 Tax=Sphingomonas sp. LM7 TaxID=1938607 RepID=UPI000983B2F0|nr:flagellar hook-basal body complex protein FliE [Sphingomonas sp. LM7]AQR73604.1 flagellar hook-basal body protein FliE [Sphingomonas sp. LM7]
MSIGALDATSAYGKVAGIGSALGTPSAGKADGAGGFGSMVEDLVTGTAQQMRAAEHASAMQVAGKGDLIDVVTAIGAAETALDTMVAVRDRVVSAYTDIMRMQI